MKQSIAYYGDPILRQKCKPVESINEEIRQLVRDLEETMLANDGVGLAAPQIKRSLAIFITNVADDEDEDEELPSIVRVYINPKVLKYSEEERTEEEGCVSIPNIYAPVRRPRRIKVEATDLNGELFTKELSGLSARAFLHENDHINGVLFIDRVRGRARERLEPWLRKIQRRTKD